MIIFSHKSFLPLVGACLVCTCAQAAESIVADLKKDYSNQGHVNVSQPYEVTRLMEQKQVQMAKKKTMTFSGFRILVYNSNQQKVAKAETEKREKAVKEKFPEVNTYSTFSSPFWKLYAGDFRTQAEALSLLTQLKSQFPAWSGELTIVKEAGVVNTDFD